VTIHRFAFPTTIHFGVGARALVADHLRAQGVHRPLIVTDKGLAALPILSSFGAGLSGLAVDVYAGVFGNPTRSQVEAGVAAYK
jgi:alcohol dehydrogenase class IV